MKRIIIFLIIEIVFTGCCKKKQIAFDREGWNFDTDAQAIPPLREFMTKSLLHDVRIKGMTTKELIDLLGEPENSIETPPNILRYEITCEDQYDDILEIESLDFYFNKDSIIESWKFEKYEVDL